MGQIKILETGRIPLEDVWNGLQTFVRQVQSVKLRQLKQFRRHRHQCTVIQTDVCEVGVVYPCHRYRGQTSPAHLEAALPAILFLARLEGL